MLRVSRFNFFANVITSGENRLFFLAIGLNYSKVGSFFLSNAYFYVLCYSGNSNLPMKVIHLWRVFVGIMMVISVANVVFLDWVWLQDRDKLDGVIRQVNQLTTAFVGVGGRLADMDEGEKDILLGNGDDFAQVTTDACGPECEKQIVSAVAAALASAPTASPSSSTTNTVTNTVTKAGTFYIPLSGTGSVDSLDWMDIPTTETIIDWAEYGGTKTVSWDGYAKVFQGNGKVLLRLFDKTNGIEVANSNMSTGSQNSVHLVSGPLSVWEGKNTYVVQVKTLTGYEGFFESGRIKVVVK